MKARPRIDFVFSGGAGVGLGHVVRCATLAAAAQRRGWRVGGWLDGDDAARAKWQELTGRDVDGARADLSPRRRAGVVALDFPETKPHWIERLAGRASPVLVIDDAGDVAGATWQLLPALHHGLDRAGEPDAGGGRPRRLVGPRYAVLPDAHRRLGPDWTAPRTRLLVSLGGADPHRVGPALARRSIEVARVTDPTLAVDVVLGPAFADAGDVESDRLTALGAHVHRGPAMAEMARLMARARLAVIGFGTSLGELAWHGTPFVCVPHHDFDRAPARALEANGIGRLLATVADVRAGAPEIDRRLAAALIDDPWLRESAARAHARLEGGRGIDRLFQILEADPAPRAPRGRRGTEVGLSGSEPN